MIHASDDRNTQCHNYIRASCLKQNEGSFSPGADIIKHTIPEPIKCFLEQHKWYDLPDSPDSGYAELHTASSKAGRVHLVDI